MTGGETFIQFLASVAVPIGTLLTASYVVVMGSRTRLPFREAEVLETYLTPVPNSSLFSRMVVRFRLSQPGGPARGGIFAFMLRGRPEKARDGSSYAQLRAYYSVGRMIRLYYVPNAEWLFGFIPESPGRPPAMALMSALTLFFGAVAVLLYLTVGYP